ncbi:hypothetical protein EV199_3210 [Pseudobacter ginsenosidimutans]|uniref:Uncharacterized protein n=1 Tax=Pseudobacter ginsenosidimutans TaxID=661488 RepID=A0A4Q7MRT0_9BACT|nr:hypothetical protein EV199_3210 [Pseudobacter ginsenosidimutans]
MIAQMTCTLITQTINIAEYLSHIGLLILTGLGFIVYFLYRFRSDCEKMKKMMLDLFNGQPLND